MVTIDLVEDLMRRSGALDPNSSSSEMGEVDKVMFDQEVLMTMGITANENR
jgi:hypothetical protein